MTEDEIHNGILKANAPNKHCFWFRRNIEDLSEEARNCKNISRFYIVFTPSGEGIDSEAAQLLKDLKENGVQKTLDAERILKYLDPTSSPEHEKYIEKLCTDFKQKVMENILEGIKEKESLDIKDPTHRDMSRKVRVVSLREPGTRRHQRLLE